jgi:hypothetical protein
MTKQVGAEPPIILPELLLAQPGLSSQHRDASGPEGPGREKILGDGGLSSPDRKIPLLLIHGGDYSVQSISLWPQK